MKNLHLNNQTWNGVVLVGGRGVSSTTVNQSKIWTVVHSTLLSGQRETLLNATMSTITCVEHLCYQGVITLHYLLKRLPIKRGQGKKQDLKQFLACLMLENIGYTALFTILIKCWTLCLHGAMKWLFWRDWCILKFSVIIKGLSFGNLDR